MFSFLLFLSLGGISLGAAYLYAPAGSWVYLLGGLVIGFLMAKAE